MNKGNDSREKYEIQTKRLINEKKITEVVKRKKTIEIIKRLGGEFGDSPFGVHSLFDIEKVFMGVQPGDYISFGEQRAQIFESILKGLGAINSDFHYTKRPAKGNVGEPHLTNEHKIEIKENKEKILKHFPDAEFGGENEVLFLYYNEKLIKQQEESYGITNLVEKVFNIREFLDIIAHAPRLTPTPRSIDAHILLGLYFSFPPCCIRNFPLTIGNYRHFLPEKYEMYIEHAPCLPDCKLSILNARLNRLAFKISGLDVGVLRDDARKFFKGVLNFQAVGVPKDEFIRLADKYNATMITKAGEYRFIHETRKSLTEMCYEVNGIPGVSNINTNTVLDEVR